jgi:hypothetical protein
MGLIYKGTKVNQKFGCYCGICGCFMGQEYYYFVTLILVNNKILNICEDCESNLSQYD